jgi:hypothetical protein
MVAYSFTLIYLLIVTQTHPRRKLCACQSYFWMTILPNIWNSSVIAAADRSTSDRSELPPPDDFFQESYLAHARKAEVHKKPVA